MGWCSIVSVSWSDLGFLLGCLVWMCLVFWVWWFGCVAIGLDCGCAILWCGCGLICGCFRFGVSRV